MSSDAVPVMPLSMKIRGLRAGLEGTVLEISNCTRGAGLLDARRATPHFCCDFRRGLQGLVRIAHGR
jgi:hypothetical protein